MSGGGWETFPSQKGVLRTQDAEGQSFLFPALFSPFLPPSLLCAFQALSYLLGNGEGGHAPREVHSEEGETGRRVP